MGKPTTCLGENKGADQLRVTAKLFSAFVFATRIVQFLYLLNPKFPAQFVSYLVGTQIVGFLMHRLKVKLMQYDTLRFCHVQGHMMLLNENNSKVRFLPKSCNKKCCLQKKSYKMPRLTLSKALRHNDTETIVFHEGNNSCSTALSVSFLVAT